MITVGLTGGICCGKSTVSKTFIKHNIPIVDADIVARQVVEPETLGWKFIRSFFGESYFNDDQTLNRIKLGNLVFNDKESLTTLNCIMKPLIEEESLIQIQKLKDAGNSIVVYDAAILIENGNADKYRPLIVVSCPQVTQLERLIKRNHLTHDDAMSRINAQMTAAEKIKHADFVIDTSGTIEESIKQTEDIILKLKQMV